MKDKNNSQSLSDKLREKGWPKSGSAHGRDYECDEKGENESVGQNATPHSPSDR